MPGGDRAAVLRATLLVALSAACFSTIAIFVTLSLRAGAPLLTVLSGRFLFGTLALVPLAGLATLRATDGSLRRALAVRAGVLQAAVVFLSGASLHWLSAAALVFLFYTYPAWVALLAAFTRTEPLTPRGIAALLLSLAGVTLMVGWPGRTSVHAGGAALALASAVVFAVYLLYTNRLQATLSPRVVSFWIALGAGAFILLATLVTGELTVTLPLPVWLYMVGLGVISTAAGYALFFRGLRQLGPVRTSIVSTIEPLWAALLGWIVLQQKLTAGTLAGGACIAAAVILLQWPARRARPAPAVT